MSDRNVDESTEFANGRLEIVTTLHLKHDEQLLDPSKAADQAIIADLLSSPIVFEDLVRSDQGREVVALVSKLPKELQRAALSCSAMKELIDKGCGAAVLGLVEKWDVTNQRRFLAAPEIAKALCERGFTNALALMRRRVERRAHGATLNEVATGGMTVRRVGCLRLD